ncbi:hypothetical protein [Bradyrhizobium sp. CCGUVB23]|uniref:hypothetical protein n=1 Tax=Bradyrhizobium sp. CCGUVB23 TaxID=2949630 RepID=UPI0020B438B4|nr:hypothetical protein [Bradyrhizobium sp. CCGUVB23]MCP3460496.1 hypothetical protein [Bradyrhizobium sp. CCGUVB23]
MAYAAGTPDVRRRGRSEVDFTCLDRSPAASDEAGAVTVLLLAGDPERLAEATDAAVVPPELINECVGRLRGAVIARKAESDLAQVSLCEYSRW